MPSSVCGERLLRWLGWAERGTLVELSDTRRGGGLDARGGGLYESAATRVLSYAL